jgi:hypothetical protein
VRLGHKIFLFIPSESISGIISLNFRFFGGDSKEVTPVPIPNTEVKLFSADGTPWETAWESRTPPEYIKKKPAGGHGGLFLLAICFVVVLVVGGGGFEPPASTV